MTATRTYIDYLHDILDAAQSARDFVQDMQVEDFIADKRTHFAVVRALNIIGEAAKRLPLSLRESYGQIPWREITGMRDKLSHDYFGVDLPRVFQTVQRDLPPLCEAVAQMLADLQRNHSGEA
ncbi:MAG: DUF86 domain-containing protein [Acidobacteriota bacterium]|nr:DUF86 domain-containing protein [Acidobacteriota bacterium]